MTLNEAKEAHAAAVSLHQAAIETSAGLRQARDEAAIAFARSPSDKKLAQSFQAARQAVEHAADHEQAFAMLVSERAAAVLEAERAEAKAAAEAAANARAADVERAGKLMAEATKLEETARAERAEIAAIVAAHVGAMPATLAMSEREAEREKFLNDARAAAGLARLDWLGNPVDEMGRRIAA